MTIYNRNKIKIVSAPCGAGKTYALGKYIQQHKDERSYLIVQPTKHLLKETKESLRNEFGIQADMLTQDSTPTVVGDVMHYLKCCEDFGHVLLITWNCYICLPYFHNRENWKIFIDEVPQTDTFYQIDVSQHIEVLRDWIEPSEAINETLAPVIPVDEEDLHYLLKKPDDITKMFRGLYQDVRNANKDVFVDLASWAQAMEHKKRKSVYFLSMLNPEPFFGTTLLAGR